MRELITHIEDRNISSMPATKLQKLMHMYEMNNDGLISYKEFTHLVNRQTIDHKDFPIVNHIG